MSLPQGPHYPHLTLVWRICRDWWSDIHAPRWAGVHTGADLPCFGPVPLSVLRPIWDTTQSLVILPPWASRDVKVPRTCLVCRDLDSLRYDGRALWGTPQRRTCSGAFWSLDWGRQVLEVDHGGDAWLSSWHHREDTCRQHGITVGVRPDH